MYAAFRCEHCGKLLHAQAAADEKVRCTHCGRAAVVPAGLATLPHPQLPTAVAPAGTVSASGTGEDFSSSHTASAVERVMPFVISLFFHVSLIVVTIFLGTMIAFPSERPPHEIPVGEYSAATPDNSPPPVFGKPAKNDLGRGPGLVREKAGDSKELPPMNLLSREIPGGGDGKIARKGASDSLIGPGGGNGTRNGRPDGKGRGLGFGPGDGPGIFPRIKWRWGNPLGGDPENGDGVRNIVFVVDRSGSMINTFDAVRDEMLSMIGRMDSEQSFHVILFSSGPPLETVGKSMSPATRENKVAAADFLTETYAKSSTDPLPAIARAFDVLDKVSGSKVIFLLTDSQFPDNAKVIELLRQRNADASKKVYVYPILYGERNREAEETMKTIAKENGGTTFKHVRPED